MKEKTRELNQARGENSHLLQLLTEERERREQLELAATELRSVGGPPYLPVFRIRN